MTLLDRYPDFVFDLDGTVYLGDALLPGLETAVAMARNAAIDAALVLAGATDRETALRAEPALTYVLEGLADLAAAGGTRRP